MRVNKRSNLFLSLFLSLLILGLPSCDQKVKSVKEVMDKVVTQLYQTASQADLAKLNYDQAMALFSKDDLEALSTKHWIFDVNVPVVVSVMRDSKQKIVPFWLERDGFNKTDRIIKNEQTTYEVWQKSFKAGRVGLGIQGLDNSGLHYFVSVAPQKNSDQLELSHFFPENQFVGVLNDGAFTYHDWDELVLTDVPPSMQGQKLLTTVRGRGIESHLVGAFRTTAYPSSQTPDQVLLTWSSDPSTSMDIQWRTDTTVEVGGLKYRESGSADIRTVEAEKIVMEDRLLMNDRFINHFTANLRELKPGTTYQYLIEPQTEWSDKFSFSTAGNDDSFSFLWFGDTHFSPEYGEILKLANESHPDASFFSIAGDLVSDGLFRNQWDELLEHSKGVISRKPLMAVPGNHDNRAGLGAQTYRDVFSYPKDGPVGVPKEQTYSFTYKNTLFLMIDGTSPIEAQTDWIEKRLSETKASWKIAMFHFPPYNWEEPYVNIQKAWVPLFDKYAVDMVFGGHTHYYMRSKPMKNGQVVDSYKNGTAYIISISLPTRPHEITNEPYAETINTNGQLYQYIKIVGDKLFYQSVNIENKIIDSFEIKKH